MTEENKNQLAVKENKTACTNQQTMLAIISRAASDPNVDVDKMERLLDVQERMMAKQAEINFNQALGDLQEELPIIKKSAKITHSGRQISDYARYEDIHKAIKPLLIKNGFSLRFNSKESNSKIIITGTLAHRDGHSITDEIPLAIDASGAKNSVQGVGSTISYGKRYLVSMLLNLVFEGEDDDGRKSGYIPITDEHAAEIKQLLQETGVDTKSFLKWVDAQSVDEMSETKYPRAVAELKSKKNTGSN